MDAPIIPVEAGTVSGNEKPRPLRQQQPGQEASGGLTPEASHLDSRRPAPSPEGRAVVDMRELKGLEIAARCKIAFEGGAWIVPSQSGKGNYRVVLDKAGDS